LRDRAAHNHLKRPLQTVVGLIAASIAAMMI